MSPGPVLDLPYSHLDADQLIQIWHDAVVDLGEVVRASGPAAWDVETRCPGWTVGDLIAHTTSLERVLLGRSDPDHEPDWAGLPHAASDFGRMTEVPVDLRRPWDREHVLAEYDDTMADRLSQLELDPPAIDLEMAGPVGGRASFERLMRTRIFDVWAHEQDVRAAILQPGHLETPPAWITAERLAGALPYVWGKRVAPPVGSSAHVFICGPGVEFAANVVVGEDGRAVLTDAASEPTVVVRLSWPDFVALGCGRVLPSAAGDLATITGDRELGVALTEQLGVTP